MTAARLSEILNDLRSESKRDTHEEFIKLLEQFNATDYASVVDSSPEELAQVLKQARDYREGNLDALKNEMAQSATLWNGIDISGNLDAQKIVIYAALTQIGSDKLVALENQIEEKLKLVAVSPKAKETKAPVAAYVSIEMIKKSIDQLDQKINKQGFFKELPQLLIKLRNDLAAVDVDIKRKMKLDDKTLYKKFKDLYLAIAVLQQKLAGLLDKINVLQGETIDHTKQRQYLSAQTLLTQTIASLKRTEKSLKTKHAIIATERTKQDAVLKIKLFGANLKTQSAVKADVKTVSLLATLQAVQSRNPFTKQARLQKAQQAVRKWLKVQGRTRGKLSTNKFEAAVIHYQNRNNLKNEEIIQRLRFIANLIRGPQSKEFSRGLKSSRVSHLQDFYELLNETAMKMEKFSAKSPAVANNTFSGGMVGMLEALDRFDWSVDMHRIANSFKSINKEDYVLLASALQAYQAKNKLSNVKMIEKIADFKKAIANNFPKDAVAKAFNQRLEKAAAGLKKLPKNTVPRDLKNEIIKRINHIADLKAALIDEMKNVPSQEDFNGLKNTIVHPIIMNEQGESKLEKSRANLFKEACRDIPELTYLRNNYRALDEVEKELRKEGVAPEVALEASERVMLKRRGDFKAAAVASPETKSLLTHFLVACRAVGKFIIDLFQIHQVKKSTVTKPKPIKPGLRTNNGLFSKEKSEFSLPARGISPVNRLKH